VDFYEAEPFGSQVADMQSGKLCALLANCHRDPKRNPDPFTAKDFMIAPPEEPERTLTEEEIEQHLKAIFGA
jgi:hypothetical protein